MSKLGHLRDFILGMTIVSLVAWAVVKPNPKDESVEAGCKKIGGVVAFTALTNEKICVKENK